MDIEAFAARLLKLVVDVASDPDVIISIIQEHGVTLVAVDEEINTPFAADVERSAIKAFTPVLARNLLRAYPSRPLGPRNPRPSTHLLG